MAGPADDVSRFARPGPAEAHTFPAAPSIIPFPDEYSEIPLTLTGTALLAL